jgi:hypothetical protein
MKLEKNIFVFHFSIYTVHVSLSYAIPNLNNRPGMLNLLT